MLPDTFAVCRLECGAAWPAWARGSFVSVTATDDELSVVCPAAEVPAEVRAERDWRVLKIVGPFAFSTVGVLASLAAPLAQAGISLLTISTYDTDYLLVKSDALERAAGTLVDAGHARTG
ncbi:MAG: ACT domain-containing protein [Verrucomicrobia bacterium]|nr:ACT domain-containing protein [Verrucomicrobiota bacterium]